MDHFYYPQGVHRAPVLNAYWMIITNLLLSNNKYVGENLLENPGIDRRRVSEIDWSQLRQETAFWWRNKGPMTSQITGLIKWPIYPWHLIEIHEHIDTCDTESMTPRCSRSTHVQLCLIYSYIDDTGVLMDALHYFAQIVRCVAIKTRATTRHFLIWMRMVWQTAIHWCCGVFRLNTLFIGEPDK